MNKHILMLLLFIPSLIYAEPRLRPQVWGRPIIGTRLQNIYLVDKGVYRSEQPQKGDIDTIRSLGIKEVLNLREFHSDNDELTDKHLLLHRVKLRTGNITEQQIIESLRIIHQRRGPILIHCWHGSDRTGVIIAAYRVIFNDWSKSDALDEMVNGGYGYHASFYPELTGLVENMNVEKIKKALNQ